MYDGNRSTAKVALELAHGTFRFISGRSRNVSYTISTTLATLGVRGTTFDLYIADSGALCVAPLSGSVVVCPRGRPCRTHGAVGRYLIVTPDQTFWLIGTERSWAASISIRPCRSSPAKTGSRPHFAPMKLLSRAIARRHRENGNTD